MKKIEELTKQELLELYEKNEDFKNYVWREAYDDSMFAQGEEAKFLGTHVFDYHDHYSSFYLSTPIRYGAKEPEAVAHKLDRDYMSPESMEAYDKLNELTDEWEAMDYDGQQSDDGCKLYDKMIEACDKLAECITEQLNAYQDVSFEDAKQWMIDMQSSGRFSNLETDGAIVYEHITREYK